MNDTYKPKFYGITGADEAYIKEHGITPDEKGEYPRLDEQEPVVKMIQTISGYVRIDISQEELDQHIAEAWTVLLGLQQLSRTREPKVRALGSP